MKHIRAHNVGFLTERLNENAEVDGEILDKYRTNRGTIIRYVPADQGLHKHSKVWYKFGEQGRYGQAAADMLYSYVTGDVLFDLIQKHPEDFPKTIARLQKLI